MANMNQYDKLGLVDFLNEMNQDSTFSNRRKLYQSLFNNLPVDYKGTEDQNVELVNALRDTYKQTGSNLGNDRPKYDALKQFALKTLSRSVYEGNRPTIRPEHPMRVMDSTDLKYRDMMNLFGYKK